MPAQEDYDALNEILTRAEFTDEEKDGFIEEVMTKLGYKLKKLFTDAEETPKGPRRIGGSAPAKRVSGGSQYSD